MAEQSMRMTNILIVKAELLRPLLIVVAFQVSVLHNDNVFVASCYSSIYARSNSLVVQEYVCIVSEYHALLVSLKTHTVPNCGRCVVYAWIAGVTWMAPEEVAATTPPDSHDISVAPSSLSTLRTW